MKDINTQLDYFIKDIQEIVSANNKITDANLQISKYRDTVNVHLSFEYKPETKDKELGINYSEVNEKVTKDRLKEIVEEIKNKPKAEVIFDNKGVTISGKGVNINGGSTRW